MRRAMMLLLSLALASCSAPAAHVGHGGGASTPAPGDEAAGMAPASAPGAVNPAVTQANIHQTICVPGWTATVRPPVSYTDHLKAQQMAALGLTGPASAYEEDHRIPLEAGGSPTSAMNLWPELWDGPRGAHSKDFIENRVHTSICAGRMTLAQGQAVFQGDWWTATVP